MPVQIDPTNVEFQKELEIVINTLKQFFLTSKELRDEKISISALLVGMEILLDEMHDQYKRLNNTKLN